VLDSAASPATGASGLPVGMLAPHYSPDDSLLSRLSRCGIRTTLQHATRLLRKGEDWALTGVLELRPADAAPVGDVDESMRPWSRAAAPGNAIWHEKAGWIKPAALVRAWLAQRIAHVTDEQREKHPSVFERQPMHARRQSEPLFDKFGGKRLERNIRPRRTHDVRSRDGPRIHRHEMKKTRTRQIVLPRAPAREEIQALPEAGFKDAPLALPAPCSGQSASGQEHLSRYAGGGT
jgi:hypothetical protein